MLTGQLWLLIILFNKKIRIKLGFWRQQWKCLKRELASGTPQFIYFNEPLKTNFYLYFTHAALACPVYCANLKCPCVPIMIPIQAFVRPSTGAACAPQHSSEVTEVFVRALHNITVRLEQPPGHKV